MSAGCATSVILRASVLKNEHESNASTNASTEAILSVKSVCNTESCKD